MLSVNFWGVRGSIPCPGRATVEYGGNTACLEIRAGERLVIVDMGTGVKPLGDILMKKDLKNHPLDIDIFITHTHWDHIMGFPMFAPLSVPSTRLRIRGPATYEDETLEAIIGAQLSYRYWPVRQSELAARIEYEALKETILDLGGGLSVTTKYLNHPILCLGYRFEYQGKSIVTAYDHEPFRNLFPTNPADPGYDENAAIEGELAMKEENDKHAGFLQNADVLIHDSQYTAAEFEKHLGWGHSSFEYCIGTAEKAGVKKLVFFHHDPNRTDEELSRLEEHYKAQTQPGMEIMIAREGLRVEA
jgi:phosphoribosyl 1,2-cyclic phosphodiesterase